MISKRGIFHYTFKYTVLIVIVSTRCNMVLHFRYTEKETLLELHVSSLVDPRFKALPYLQTAEKEEVKNEVIQRMISYELQSEERVS